MPLLTLSPFLFHNLPFLIFSIRPIYWNTGLFEVLTCKYTSSNLLYIRRRVVTDTSKYQIPKMFLNIKQTTFGSDSFVSFTDKIQVLVPHIPLQYSYNVPNFHNKVFS